MRPHKTISHRTLLFGDRHPKPFFSLLFLLVISCDVMRAQNTVQAVPDDPAPYTLHLYARLVEIPTMILFAKGQRPATLGPQQVNIKLNSAPTFHPTSLRMEGNDPLSIAILLDMSGDQPDFLSALQKDFAGWVTKSLRPQDHVSIYALDCNLIETSHDLPASSAALQKGLDVAITTPLTHGTSSKPSCGRSIRLRGSAVFVMRRLYELPGRRVLLIVTTGRDGKSNISWPQVDSEAGIDSVYSRRPH